MKTKQIGMNGELSAREENAFYESGLSADGCLQKLGDYERKAIQRYGKILTEPSDVMDWNQYALELATIAARKSKDPWRKVGACLLRHDNTVAGIGYNGFPAGMREDWQDRDKRRAFVIHAEQNALRYVKPEECGLIAVTLLPCNDCLRSIASYGIKTVVYRDTYERDETSICIAGEFGIDLIQL